MVINFLVNEVYGGWKPTDDFLGGTEESVVRWAEGLVKRGHSVRVFQNHTGTQDIEHNGVIYHSRYRYGTKDADVCINIKSSEVPPKEPTLYFTNETNASELDLSAYKGVVWPSQWCVDNIPVNNKTYVLPHGYDPKEIYPSEKISKLCLYASSPDRGLDTLLEVWPQVVESHPDAQLVVTYGATPRELPNALFMGKVDQQTMNELYREADVWCHPCNGGELFCITGINAQAAGCVPVVIPKMALAETVKHGVFATKEDYAEVLINLLGDTQRKAEIRELLDGEKYPTWDDTTDMLERLIKSVV